MIEACPKCGLTKTDENCNRHKSGKYSGNFLYLCSKCSSNSACEWASDNRPHVREKARARREIWKSRIDLLKSERPCYDCGGSFPPEACDFDHVIGEKQFDVSTGLGKSWDEVRLEIDKCQLVCSNCHRVRTSQRTKQKKENGGTPLTP